MSGSDSDSSHHSSSSSSRKSSSRSQSKHSDAGEEEHKKSISRSNSRSSVSSKLSERSSGDADDEKDKHAHTADAPIDNSDALNKPEATTTQINFIKYLQEINDDLDALTNEIEQLLPLHLQTIKQIPESQYSQDMPTECVQVEAPINNEELDVNDTPIKVITNSSACQESELMQKRQTIIEESKNSMPSQTHEANSTNAEYNQFYRNREQIFSNVRDLYRKPAPSTYKEFTK